MKREAPQFTAADAARFYDRFGKKQDLQFYENRAIDRLATLGDFEHAHHVFELGCGTGRLAERLLRDRLPSDARYVGVDVSRTMVNLATDRLRPFGKRVELRCADGSACWPDDDGACDRFVVAYVLDLLEESATSAVLTQAHRLIAPGGTLCVVAMTEGRSILSRAICRAWNTARAASPKLVGGCRPVSVDGLLDRRAWRLEHREIISSFGICSEVVIAAPQ